MDLTSKDSMELHLCEPETLKISKIWLLFVQTQPM